MRVLVAVSSQVPLRSRIDGNRTELTRQRYDRIAPFCNALEWLMELRFRRWRRELWGNLAGDAILELGIGTGKNLRFYPSGKNVTAIDLSEKMLERARRRAERLGTRVQLQVADVQALPFEDASFDEVVATFLFCSVPDPVLGLREARRVLRPGGRLLLLEHVISEVPLIRTLMRWFDPIPFRIWGAHIDRDTVANVRTAGFVDIASRSKALGLIQLIKARAA